MTTVNASIVWKADTPDRLYDAMKSMAAAFDAVGVARADDTGQFSLTGTSAFITPAMLPSISAAAVNAWPAPCFEIRKLEAVGLPTIYLKIRYGLVVAVTGQQSSWRPLISITTATATDGAGNLSGVVNNYPMGSGGYSNYGSTFWTTTASAAGRPLKVASDGANWLTFILDPTAQGGDSGGSCMAAFGIERTITPGDGSFNGDGWVQIDFTGNNNYSSYAPAGGYSITSILSSFTVNTYRAIPSQTPGMFYTSSGTGNSCSLFPITVMTPVPQGPMSAAVVYFTNDIVVGVEFKATLYGKLINYLPLGQNPINMSNCNPSGSASYSAALRYE